MKKLWIGAALALLTTSAHAGQVFNFGINGGTARIELPRNCRELSCLNLSFTDRNGKQYTTKDLDNLTSKDKDSKVTESPVASPFANKPQPPVAAPVAPAVPTAAPPANSFQAQAPAPRPQVAAPPPRYEPPPVPPRQEEQAYDVEPSPAPARVPETEAPARQPERVATNRVELPPAPAPVAQPVPTGPVGEWLVEDATAQIRIEPCGANLCGYVSQSTSSNDTDRKNPDPKLRNHPIIGTQILIDMKPNKARWDGTIYNPKDGSSYTSHISMRNPNTLRVEGCAFGGLFCGGQNWKRVM
jgi:uncharacterized protein (DUF2147 family)